MNLEEMDVKKYISELIEIKKYMGQHLGQHFLHEEQIVDDIVEASGVSEGELVLEIGPGKGILTDSLLEVGAQVVAIEKDGALIETLHEQFEKEIENERLILKQEDIRDVDPVVLEQYGESYRLVANIPYYITGTILRQFLSTDHQPTSMTLLVQKEVAERILAENGKESVLSLSVKVYGKPEYIRTVGKGAFTPPPNVDSAVLHIENISRSFFEKNGIAEELFFTVIKTGFRHKRKTLANNLSSLYTKQEVKKALSSLNISANVRAEDLSLSDWKDLINHLH